MPVVRLSDDLFERLQKYARPLVDSVSDVLTRILDENESLKSGKLPVPAVEATGNTPFKGYPELWAFVAEEFNRLSPPVRARPTPVTSYYKKVTLPIDGVHYEWSVRESKHSLDVCLHSEFDSTERSMDALTSVLENESSIRRGIPFEYSAGPWGRKWAQAMFRIPYE